jgi:ketosteroid isomerase-like protein
MKNQTALFISWTKLLGLSISFLLSCGVNNSVRAENQANVPAELTEIITQIETAANNRDLDKVMKYYSPDFTNSDGLTLTSLSQALAEMWKTYPQLQYTTAIKSWQQAGDELVAETVTQITGTSQSQGRTIKLNTTLRSRQYFQEQQLVRQEILSEQTKVTTGEHPPEVEVIVPETVKVGEKYNFDVIVTEPLKDKVLLGATMEEPTGSDRYLNPGNLELEALPAGGIYKLVTAPRLPDNHWLSAILVRGDGITIVTRRVRIAE